MGNQRKHIISDNVSIVSSFDSGSKCFEDHYREQQKVRHFMTFMYGDSCTFVGMLSVMFNFRTPLEMGKIQLGRVLN